MLQIVIIKCSDRLIPLTTDGQIDGWIEYTECVDTQPKRLQKPQGSMGCLDFLKCHRRNTT